MTARWMQRLARASRSRGAVGDSPWGESGLEKQFRKQRFRPSLSRRRGSVGSRCRIGSRRPRIFAANCRTQHGQTSLGVGVKTKLRHGKQLLKKEKPDHPLVSTKKSTNAAEPAPTPRQPRASCRRPWAPSLTAIAATLHPSPWNAAPPRSAGLFGDRSNGASRRREC